MADVEQEAIASRFGRWARIVGLSLVAVFLVGVGGGVIAAHMDHGGGVSMTFAALLAGVALALAGVVWLLLRNIKRPTGEEPLTKKERLNRNLLISSGAIGGVMGAMVVLALIASGEKITPGLAFSDAPLPTAVAIVLVVILGLIVPALSYYWHRSAVDEQEADAYKTGALWGLYVFMIGGPVWWFAWRGGFAPEPNGMIIFFAVMITAGVIWFWKKYR